MKLGNELKVNCTVSADFPVNVSLSKDDNPLILDADYVYTVHNATNVDAGKYTCFADYGRGGSGTIIRVEVGDVPGTVSNITIVEVGNGELVIEWNAADSNGVTITNYEVVFANNEREILAKNVSETTITVTQEDLNGHFFFTTSVSAINGIGKGETVTVFASTSSSFRPVITHALLSVLLIVAVTCY